MKILLVNGYSTKNIQQFRNFQKLIYEYYQNQKDNIDTETEFFVRDRQNITDFLYDQSGSLIKEENAKKFDSIDLVYITGDANLRPWSDQAKKMIILLRMCLSVNKIVFASSFAMQALVYLSATNFDKEYIAINGAGNCSSVKELYKFSSKEKEYGNSHIFIDNITGDIYQFNVDGHQSWQPVCNAGFHYHKAASEFQKLGQFILKAPVFTDHKALGEKIYLNTDQEILCNLKKSYLQHWLFKDVNSVFKTISKNTWDAHTFTKVSGERQFKILAESNRGPSIIIFKNIIATQFDILNKYPESVQILKNFNDYFTYEYKTCKLQVKSIFQVHLSKNNKVSYLAKENGKIKNQTRRRDIKVSNNKKNQEINKQQENQPNKNSLELLEESNKFFHVGMGASKRRNQSIVQNNTIFNKTIKFKHQNTTVGDSSPSPRQQFQNFNNSLSSINLRSAGNLMSNKSLGTNILQTYNNTLNNSQDTINDNEYQFGNKNYNQINSKKQQLAISKFNHGQYSHTLSPKKKENNIKFQDNEDLNSSKNQFYKNRNIQIEEPKEMQFEQFEIAQQSVMIKKTQKHDVKLNFEQQERIKNFNKNQRQSVILELSKLQQLQKKNNPQKVSLDNLELVIKKLGIDNRLSKDLAKQQFSYASTSYLTSQDKENPEEKPNPQQIIAQYKAVLQTMEREDKLKMKDREISKDAKSFNRATVRNFLHPQLSQKCIFNIPHENPHWVPGYYTARKKNQNNEISNKIINNNTNMLINISNSKEKKIMDSSDNRKWKQLSKTKKFNTFHNNTTNSSQNSYNNYYQYANNNQTQQSQFLEQEPFLTFEELKKKWQQEEDKKIIGPKQILTSIKLKDKQKNDSDFMFINTNNTTNVNQYSFREKHKEKWVNKTQRDFILV